MAIVKLVCQSCGANLDAMDESRVIQCSYCGTSNQIKQTVHPTPPQYAAPPQYVNPQQPVIPSARANAKAGSGVAVFVVIMALVPLLIGGAVAWFAFRTGVSSFEQLSQQLNGALNNGMRQFYWSSGHPLVTDVDGDQTDDAIGMIQEIGEQKLLLTAISGSNYATLWEVELGRVTDLPDVTLYLEPTSKLMLVAIGPALHAHDLSNGTVRWVASLPDKVENVALDGDHLWVATIDKATSSVALIDGKVTPTADPSPTAMPLRDDGEYDLIPDLGQLDLEYDQFEGMRVSQAFCPVEDLPLVSGYRHDEESKRCRNPNGLAFLTRDKGTSVPFMIGYARDTKAERWRVQLTKAGSLETIDTGFGQPRAEFFGDEAIISLVPSVDNNARVRRISLIDGSIAWETTLVRKNIENIDGMGVGNNRVFVKYGQSLRVLSLADGTELASLGGF
jgi:DNA-directed RNA polymerase subunit RPC12/RpoP